MGLNDAAAAGFDGGAELQDAAKQPWDVLLLRLLELLSERGFETTRRPQLSQVVSDHIKALRATQSGVTTPVQRPSSGGGERDSVAGDAVVVNGASASGSAVDLEASAAHSEAGGAEDTTPSDNDNGASGEGAPEEA